MAIQLSQHCERQSILTDDKKSFSETMDSFCILKDGFKEHRTRTKGKHTETRARKLFSKLECESLCHCKVSLFCFGRYFEESRVP